MKNKNITFIVGTLDTGGAEKQLFLQVNYLVKIGFEVSIITFSKGEYWEKKIVDIGANIHFINRKVNKLVKLVNIYKLLKLINPDRIISSHNYINIYCGILGRILSIKSYGAFRSNLIDEIKDTGILINYIAMRLLKNAITNNTFVID